MNSTGFKTLLSREIKRFLRFPVELVVQPLISALLFMIVFGEFIGKDITVQNGIPFIAFIVPGIIALDLITASYSSSAYSVFLMRFLNFIADLLAAPLSYTEMVLAFTLGAIVRGTTVAIIILLASALFTPIRIFDPLLFVFFIIATSFTFASIGIIVGLWAKEFENVEVLTVFILTPLAFLGGVFTPLSATPPALQGAIQLNPIFHMVNGLRYSMTGINEGSIPAAVLLLAAMSALLFYVNLQLFKKGWGLRT